MIAIAVENSEPPLDALGLLAHGGRCRAHVFITADSFIETDDYTFQTLGPREVIESFSEVGLRNLGFIFKNTVLGHDDHECPPDAEAYSVDEFSAIESELLARGFERVRLTVATSPDAGVES
jgi:hypothetical protein